MIKFFRYIQVRHCVLLMMLFFIPLKNVYSQNTNYKEYSYTEFFELIEKEKDTIFELSNALIVFNQQDDKRFTGTYIDGNIKFNINDTVYIKKHIVFKKVIFDINFDARDSLGRQVMPFFHHMVFEKSLRFENSHNASFSHCVFKENFTVRNDDRLSEIASLVKPKLSSRAMWMRIRNCILKNGLSYSNYPKEDNDLSYDFELSDSKIYNTDRLALLIQMRNQASIDVANNIIKSENWSFIFPDINERLRIESNDFGNSKIYMQFWDRNVPRLRFVDNKINNPILLNLPVINENASVGWKQLDGKIIDGRTFDKYFGDMAKHGLDTIPELAQGTRRSNAKIKYYQDRIRIENNDVYNQEIKLRGTLYRVYKNQYLTEAANSVYMELKDLETARLKYLFRSNPSFDKYFKWKVNQFLRVFSNYGTEPSKAVTFSFYVVLFFALIYLFFPNSWDKHGKNRIMERYRFFTKYMNKEAGIHEVYLEEQKEELLESEDFKTYMLKAEKHIPKFFMATAIPLYKWSVSGTKLSASLLKRVDIMKGSWQDLPQHQRVWKSILLIGAFIIAIIYDLFIKVLNALMLSINTFTTLGFGEIPIKGLPRYLAIVQGFIGWFMLTIFSVSLISQLLN